MHNIEGVTPAFALIALFATGHPVSQDGQPAPIASGSIVLRVVDAHGLPIKDAQVALTQTRSDRGLLATATPDGFRFDGLTIGVFEITASASRFETRVERVDLRERPFATLEIRLEATGLTEQLVVTPSRSEQRLADVPASVAVLGRSEIERSPAMATDEALRQIPAFSLFRRTSSLASHPTSQGVSLRGIGPSGASRTLVLIDNVPFNDPFGGWVYWDRAPLATIERIEVVNGSSSSLYGNSAMGGVISILTRRPERRTVEIAPQYGARNTRKLDASLSDRWNKTAASLEGSAFDTDGYSPVARSERGPIDIESTVRFVNVLARLEYTPSERVHLFLRAGAFDESRINGKVGEFNDTHWTTASAGLRVSMKDLGDFQARLFGDNQDFHSTFLAVINPGAARDFVRLATDQNVPVRGLGGMAQWLKPAGRTHSVTAGLDARIVEGDSREDAYVAVTPTVLIGPLTQKSALSVQRVSGGRQRNVGLFVQDAFAPSPEFQLTLSARLDGWWNDSAHNLETAVSTGLPTPNHRPSLESKQSHVLSPRLAAIYHANPRISIWGNFGKAFRAPTLNELYRQFSVGAVVTRANQQLGPERLVGGEVGLNVSLPRGLTVHASWFDNRMKDPVSNVTIGTNLQQRQNLGKARIHGVQSDLEWKFARFWTVSAGYLHNQARVKEFAANPASVGRFLPQVPVHRGSAQVSYANPKRLTLTASFQFSSRQFDDDLNVRVIPAATLRDAGYGGSSAPGLPGYANLDLRVSRDLGARTQAFLGVQNLSDRRSFVQTGPSTLGSPRLISGGFRFRLAGRPRGN